MEQVLHLRGADIRVRWLLVECEPPSYARWEGRGPARTQARIEYRLTAVAGGHALRLRRTSSSRRSARVGALASRTVMGQLRAARGGPLARTRCAR